MYLERGEEMFVAINEERCTFFSTIPPRNAADIPRKKIAKLNAHSVAPLENPM